jgi:hypothetical protein
MTKIKTFIEQATITTNSIRYNDLLKTNIPFNETKVDPIILSNLILKDILETIATKGNYQVGAVNAFYSVCEDYGLKEAYFNHHVVNYEEYIDISGQE